MFLVECILKKGLPEQDQIINSLWILIFFIFFFLCRAGSEDVAFWDNKYLESGLSFSKKKKEEKRRGKQKRKHTQTHSHSMSIVKSEYQLIIIKIPLLMKR